MLGLLETRLMAAVRLLACFMDPGLRRDDVPALTYWPSSKNTVGFL
jgi:hypothetical protein